MEWLCRATSAALMLFLAQSAGAAEIKVLCIPGMKAALEALLPQFERDAGHKVAIHYEIYVVRKGKSNPAISTSQSLPRRKLNR